MCSSSEDIKCQLVDTDHESFVNKLSSTIGKYINDIVDTRTSKYSDYETLIEHIHNLPIIKKYERKIEKLKKKNRKLKEKLYEDSENMKLVINEGDIVVDLTNDDVETSVNDTIKLVKVKVEPELFNEVREVIVDIEKIHYNSEDNSEDGGVTSKQIIVKQEIVTDEEDAEDEDDEEEDDEEEDDDEEDDDEEEDDEADVHVTMST